MGSRLLNQRFTNSACISCTDAKAKLAVDRYKERASKYVKILEEHIAMDAAAGRSTGVTTLFSWFSFDVMGEFVFGNSFNMLQSRGWHFIILRLRQALALLGPMTPVPWLVHLGFQVGRFLPSIKTWFAMIAWCRKQMENRAKVRLLKYRSQWSHRVLESCSSADSSSTRAVNLSLTYRTGFWRMRREMALQKETGVG